MEKIVRQAAVIFAGRVKSVQPPSEGRNAFVVTFTVTDGIRGANTGDEFQLREWPGPWTASNDRYRIGQAVILMLHAPGDSGLTSTVGGPLGRIDVSGTSALKLTDLQRAAIRRSLRLARVLYDESGKAKSTVAAGDLLRSLREEADRELK